MSERWIITPEGGRPLVLPLRADAGAQVVGIATPSPARRVSYAPRPEGSTPTSREWENREITLQVALVPPRDPWATETHDFGAPAPQAEGDGDPPGWTGNVRRAGPDGNPILPMLSDISSTAGALASGGGVVRRILDDGTWLEFDVHDGEISDGPSWDSTYYAARATTVTVKLNCAPFGRGRERLLGEATKSTGTRLLVVGGLQVPGDVPALARIEYSGATAAQQSLLYAIDTEPYPLEITGASRILPSPAATVGGGSVAPTVAMLPASPSGTPAGTWEVLAFIRSSAGRVPLVGTYRILARVLLPAVDGARTSMRLRWSAGPAEGGMISNTPVAPIDGWSLVDLGVVTVPAHIGEFDGVVEWQGPFNVTGRALDVLMLVPTARSARAFASRAEPIGNTVVVADTLAGTGDLVGSAVQTGGTWSALGTTGAGFVRTTTGATRTATNQSRAGAGAPIARPSGPLQARVRIAAPGGASRMPHGLAIGNAAGLAAIATGTAPTSASAWAVGMGYDGTNPDRGVLDQITDVAVSGTTITYSSGGKKLWTAGADGAVLNVNFAPRDASQQVEIVGWATPDGTKPGNVAGIATAVVPGIPTSPGQLYVGLWGRGTGLTTSTTTTLRFSDLFAIASVQPDRALHPGRTAQFSTAVATRETPAGGTGPIAAMVGDRPLLPPSGRQSTPTRVLMGTSRDDLRTGVESTTGDTFTGRVFATPRYLQIPDHNA